MFENIHLLVPPVKTVTPADLDHLERTFACTLPPDYRAFLTRFGAGLIGEDVHLYAPSDILQRTRKVRELLGTLEDAGQIRFFTWYENTSALFQPQDLDRLLSIGGTMSNDYFMLLPGVPPRFFEFPRNEYEMRVAGTTMEDFLRYLEPTTRHGPQAWRIVDHGLLRETTGLPDEAPYPHSFIPEDCVSLLVEEELTWGHSNDGRVNERLPQREWGSQPPVFHMAHYPLLRLLEEMALRDPTLRFAVRESETPTAELQVPRFPARLRTGSGLEGLTLYILIPLKQTTAFYRWLAAEAQALGYSIPVQLRTLSTEGETRPC